MDLKKTKKCIVYIILSLITTGFMLIIAQSASPLFGLPRGDGWAFFTMGKAVLSGKIPYINFFDHKGPLIFFINAIPQYFIKGTLGIFILETLMMIICVCLIYKIACLFFDYLFSIIFPVLYLIYQCPTLIGGNYTEEYSNAINMIFIYIFIRFVLSKKDKFNIGYGMLGGFLFGLLAMIRINSAFPLAAGIIAILYLLIKNKQYKNLFANIGMFLLGCAAALLPFILYFHSHHALMDMINGTFLFNMKYTLNFKIVLIENKFIILLILSSVPILLSSLFSFKKNKAISIFAFVTCVGSIIFACMAKTFFVHYLIALSPVFTLGCLFCVYYFPGHIKLFSKIKIKRISIVITVVTLVFTLIYGNDLYTFARNEKDIRVKYINEIISMIPEDEKDSVLCYSVQTHWYYVGNIPINYKYFSFQEWWSYATEVQTETVSYLEHNPPKWIICTTRKLGNKKFKLLLKQKYKLIKKNKPAKLYKLKANYAETVFATKEPISVQATTVVPSLAISAVR